MRPVVIHLHVPKTAGVSVAAALLETVPPRRTLTASRNAGIPADFRALTNAERDATYDVLLGHDWVWGAHRFFDRPVVYVSILRDPVARIASHFNYIHTRPGNGRHAWFRRELADLDAITLQQMRHLAVMWSNFAAALYDGRTRRLTEDTFPSLEARLRAEAAEGRFILGNAAAVSRALVERGILDKPLPHIHTTPADNGGAFVRADPDALSQRTRRLLVRFNRWDLRLWRVFGDA